MLLKITRCIFLVLILGVLIALGSMQLKPVKEFVIAQGIDLFTHRFSQHLEIDNVELLLPFEIKITNPKLFTLEGKKRFEASAILIRINPYTFFSSSVHLHSLRIEDAKIPFEKGKEPISMDEILSFLPTYSLTINHLQLIRYKIPETFEKYVESGIYDIDAKIEYDPKEKYAFIAGDITKEGHSIPCVDMNVALFVDEELGFLGFEACKEKGVFIGPLSPLSLRLSGNFSGSPKDWLHFLNHREEVGEYHLDGNVRALWTYFIEGNPQDSIQGSLSTSIDLGNNFGIILRNFGIKTPLFHTESTLFLSKEGSFAGTKGSVTIHDLHSLFSRLGIQKDIDTGGTALLNFQLEGTVDAPQGEIELHAGPIKIHGKELENIWGEVAFLKKQEGTQGTLHLYLQDQDKRLSSVLSFDSDLESHLQVSNFSLDLPWGQGKGNFSWQKDRGFELGMTANIHDLAFLQKITNFKMEGSIDASLFYTTTRGGSPELYVRCDSKKLLLENSTFDDFYLEVEVAGTREEFSCYGKALAKRITHEGVSFDNIDLKLGHQSIEKVSPFQLDFNYNEEPFSLNGTFKGVFPEELQIEIASLYGKFEGESFFLKSPFQITTDFSSFNTTPLTFSFGHGSIFANASKEGELWHTFLRFNNLPCGIFPFEEIFSQHLEGDAEGEATFYGTYEDIQGSLRLDVHDLFAKEDVGKKIPVLKGSLTAAFAHGAMQCQGEISGIGDNPLKFQGTLPLSLSLSSPFFALDREKNLKAFVEAEGPLTPLFELFIHDAASFVANGKIHVNLEGTLNNPEINGSFSLRKGVFEIHDLGTVITNIEADFKGNGTYLELLRLTGSDGESGAISGSGIMLISREEAFPFRCTFLVEHAKPFHRDMFTGSTSGTLVWHGTLENSLIEGNLSIHQGELFLPKKIPETAVSYQVRYINNDKNDRIPTEVMREGILEIPVELNIQVGINDSFSIKDEDLKSLWKGKIDLQGNVQKPLLFGEIKLISGDYLLNGKRFDLLQGRVSFNGDFEKKSTVYVSLSKEIQEHEVEIVLKGSLKDPEILLQSHPSLPKQQVLSLILFGRTSAEISELQEEQLEQSLANLSNSSKKEGVLSKFQKTLGIDHIDFMRSNETSPEMRIRLSKYISPGVCLSIYRDVGEDINAVAIEAEIQKNIKAQIEAQDNAQGQLSIFWKKNY